MGPLVISIVIVFAGVVAAVSSILALRTLGPLDAPDNPRTMHRRAHHHEMH